MTRALAEDPSHGSNTPGRTGPTDKDRRALERRDARARRISRPVVGSIEQLRSLARRVGPSTLAWSAAVWVVLLPRLVPTMASDRGIFVSVAERLIAGDALYSGVWDNKDPYFYLSLAAARWVSPYADVALEVLWLAIAAVATLIIARRLGLGVSAATFAGLVVAPIVLTGAAYAPGYTHLPGIALSLAAAAAALSRRWVLAGALVVTVAAFKIILTPLALVLVAIPLIADKKREGVRPLLIGAFVLGVTLVGVLAARGELGPSLDALLHNISYSQTDIAQSRWGPVAGHLSLVLTQGAQVTILATLTLLALTLSRGEDIREAWGDPRIRTAWVSATASLILALGITGITGLWWHHAQVFHVAAILAALPLIGWMVPEQRRPRPARLLALAGVALVLSGVAHPAAAYLRPWIVAESSIRALGEPSLQARAVLASGEPASYARIGSNDDPGHALGLREWDLACARFHQYPFDSPQTFDGVLNCLPTADVVLVLPSARPLAGEEAWNSFVSDVRDLLAEDFACRVEPFGEVCERR